MTKYLLILLVLLTSCEKSVDVLQLQERQGVFYDLNTEMPYTGNQVLRYSNGKKQFEGSFENGKPNGTLTAWHKNGQKEWEKNYKNGRPEGVATAWYEDGQREWEFNYEDGKLEGMATKWSHDGAEVHDICYRNDGVVPMSECEQTP